MSEPRQAVVLAAGRGSRLAPITDLTPKPLVPVYNVPLLAYALAHLVRAGVARVAVNVHHRADEVATWVAREGARRFPQLELHISHEAVLLGTGGALARLRSWLAPEPFWVVNSDAMHLIDLAAVARRHVASGADATLLVTRAPELAHERRVLLAPAAGGRRITGFVRDRADDGATFCGLHIAGPGLLDHVTEEPSSVVWEGYVPWLRAGAHLRAESLTGQPWIDVGTPERYVAAHRALFHHVDELLALGLHAD